MVTEGHIQWVRENAREVALALHSLISSTAPYTFQFDSTAMETLEALARDMRNNPASPSKTLHDTSANFAAEAPGTGPYTSLYTALESVVSHMLKSVESRLSAITTEAEKHAKIAEGVKTELLEGYDSTEFRDAVVKALEDEGVVFSEDFNASVIHALVHDKACHVAVRSIIRDAL